MPSVLRTAVLALCALTLTGFGGGKALAAIRIRIEYDYYARQVAPQPQMRQAHGADTYILSGHQLSYVNADKIRPLGNSVTEEDRFGRGTVKITTHVTDHSVTIVSESPTDQRITKIITDGSTACTATRMARLKPAKQYFVSYRIPDRALLYDSEQRWDNVTCSIDSE